MQRHNWSTVRGNGAGGANSNNVSRLQTHHGNRGNRGEISIKDFSSDV
tara:strand:- start:286 stop:429 length:144 start_codon:yes stop_codon:yes gene_type:complete